MKTNKYEHDEDDIEDLPVSPNLKPLRLRHPQPNPEAERVGIYRYWGPVLLVPEDPKMADDFFPPAISEKRDRYSERGL